LRRRSHAGSDGPSITTDEQDRAPGITHSFASFACGDPSIGICGTMSVNPFFDFLAKENLVSTTVKKTRPELVRRLLLARGADPEDTLRLDTLFSPLGKQQMLGMREAIQWIAYAAQARWPVLIVGDYDVDGACSTAILRKGLEHLFPLRSLVPNRLTEGYGLSESVADRIGSDIRMVITVDNGIAAHAGIARLKARGVTVIVTDHHLPGATRPPADVIVDPNQPGCPFPFKSTCGAGWPGICCGVCIRPMASNGFPRKKCCMTRWIW